MIIDVIAAVSLLLAIIKGFQKGFIIAVFSVLAFIAGIAAALKFSSIAAAWIGQSINIGTQWLPFAGFIAVFIAVVLLIRIGAKFIEGAVKLVLLGWLNKLLGVVLFALLYLIILSVFLFYIQQMNLFSEAVINESLTYPYLNQLAPSIIDRIGSVIPFFKDLFEELSGFFEKVNQKIEA